MSVVVVGLNHRTVPLEILERTTVTESALPKALDDLCTREHLSEVVVLSTCMRTEVYAVAETFHGALADARNFIAERSSLAPEELSDHLYSYYGRAAAAHLFEVASGIDSAVLGESEVLGQVRAACERARDEGAAGNTLSTLFRHAVEVGKRARTETGIARGTTSVSQAAVALATERLGGSLDGRRVVVLGAGEMAEGMAAALAASPGVAEVLVANRTWSKAASLARRIGGRAVETGALAAALEDADVMLTSTGSASVILEAADLEPVLPARGGRPLLVVDVAVPRDVDGAVGRLPGVTLLDMEDLRGFAEAGVAGRRREIAGVKVIVAEEVDRYLDVATAREAAPLIASLHGRAEEIRRAELARSEARLRELDPRQRAAVEALSKAVVAKLLHEPTVRVKDAAGTVRGERLAEALRTLFDL